MKKLGLGLFCAAASLCILLAGMADYAFAIGTFKDGFYARYVKEDSGNAKEQTLAEAATASTGKCYICHVNMTKLGEKGLGKKVRNNYGKALSAFLEKDNFSSERREAQPDKVAAEVQAALEKVEAMKSDPANASSPTFLELIQSGKLPGDGKPDAADVKRAIAERDAEE